ncbi:MAG: hypothetical protein ACFFE4_20950 [Candidatus Thorarchaeota archaeon]
MNKNEFDHLGTTNLRKREIGNRKISKEVYINHLLSVKMVNRYTLICVNELELMEFTRRGSEFESTVKTLKKWYENNYLIEIGNLDFILPLLRELSYSGDSEARNIYLNLIYNKEIVKMLIDTDFYDFFEGIYNVYLKLENNVEENFNLIEKINLDDLRWFYFYEFRLREFDNDFYRIIWDIVKEKLKIPQSMIDENVVDKLFKAYVIKDCFRNSENLEAYFMDFQSIYNKAFFIEIIDKLLIQIFEEETLRMQFLNKFNQKASSISENCPAEMILIDTILRCSELGDNFFEFDTCGELVFHEEARFGDNCIYLSFPEFLRICIITAEKVIKMNVKNLWEFKLVIGDFLDYSFLTILQQVLVYIKKQNLTQDRNSIKDLILGLKRIRKRRK